MASTRYPRAVWHGPVVNQGGTLHRPRLIVLHVMQGSLSGTNEWFHNAAAEVSAHFGVGKNGTVYQWVELDRVAWAEMAYNEVAISIEHEGYSGEVLTADQAAASLALCEWLGAQFDIPFRRTSDPSGSGLIGHGELGVRGGDHPDCPGTPILSQVQRELNKQAAHQATKKERIMSDPTTTPTKAKAEISLPSLEAIESKLVPLLAYVGIGVTTADADHLTTAVRAVLLAVSGLVAAVHHNNLTK